MRLSGGRRQRGAVAVSAAIIMLAGLVAAALVIDLGRLFFAQRELQRVANMAALDASRIAGGCMGQMQNPEAAAFSEVLGSIDRNVAARSQITPQRVEIGGLYTDGGIRYFGVNPSEKNRAVQVLLRRPAPGRLLPIGAGAGPEMLFASAAAYSRPTATLRIGSTLAQLSPDIFGNVLERVLGTRPAVSLGGYQALAAADLPLTDLLEELGVGTPEQIIESKIEVDDLLHALVQALGNNGDALAANAARAVANAATSGREVIPGDLLLIEQVGDAAAGGLVNVGALLLSVAQAANGSELLNLPIQLPPPLGPGETTVRIIIPATQGSPSPADDADAPASNDYVHNGQIVMRSGLKLIDIPLLGDVSLPVFVQGAQATAAIRSIDCARRGKAFDEVTVAARSSIARVGIGDFDDISAPYPQVVPATLVKLADLKLPVGLGGIEIPVPVRVEIKVGAFADLPSDRRDLVFRPPWGEPQTLSSRPQSARLAEALAQLPGQLDIQVGITVLNTQLIPQGLLNTLLEPVRTLIASTLRAQLLGALTAGLDQQLLLPLANTLGLSLGGAEVIVSDVQSAEPYLFTR